MRFKQLSITKWSARDTLHDKRSVRPSYGDVPPDVEIRTAALLTSNRKVPGVDSQKESDAMPKLTTSRTFVVTHQMEEAWQAVDVCFGRFYVEDLCGNRHARGLERRGHRWGRTRGKIGYHEHVAALCGRRAECIIDGRTFRVAAVRQAPAA
jgi:hypothetical protein